MTPFINKPARATQPGAEPTASADDGAVRVRDLQPKDMPSVRKIDATHAGKQRTAFWRRIVQVFFARPENDRFRVALAAETTSSSARASRRFSGFLLGEVRAFEFGSDACGWIFAVGVDPQDTREGVASALLKEACARFKQQGVHKVRTMVLREDIPVLALFRSSGFVGGAFVQLEVELDDDGNAAPSTENAA